MNSLHLTAYAYSLRSPRNHQLFLNLQLEPSIELHLQRSSSIFNDRAPSSTTNEVVWLKRLLTHFEIHIDST
ncbi:hypothetical protein CR513_29163, partial [Mucuna pruriens]